MTVGTRGEGPLVGGPSRLGARAAISVEFVARPLLAAGAVGLAATELNLLRGSISMKVEAQIESGSV